MSATEMTPETLKQQGLVGWLAIEGNTIIESSFDFDLTTSYCWNMTKQTAHIVREQGLDGLASWAPFKQALETRDAQYTLAPGIAALVKKHYRADKDDTQHAKSILKIGNVVLEHNDVNDELKECHHFLIQHFRIAAMCTDSKITIAKLMQLAYNAGQLNAQRNKYNNSIIAFYDEHKLGDITTFISF